MVVPRYNSGLMRVRLLTLPRHSRVRHHLLLPPLLLPASVAIYLFLGIGPNSFLALGAIMVLLLGSALLWRSGEPPILSYVFGFQWLQASIAIFHSNVRGGVLGDFNQLTHSSWLATVLSLTGLVFLAVGMRFGAGGPLAAEIRLAHHTIHQHSGLTWFALYLVVSLLAMASLSLALYVPGLSQPLLALANLKWAAFMIFTIATFTRTDYSRSLWLAAFAIELALSFGGYFASFKTVFLITLIGLASAGVRVSAVRLAGAVALGALLIGLAVVWTAVKGDYRSFVNSGTRQQNVSVDYGAATIKLLELVEELDADNLTDAADRMVQRIAYVDFFGAVLDNVPKTVPHEYGALWYDAITRPFMPRFFFPEKAIIDESALTNKYTGLGLAGMDEGTQFSIGYMGDSYIDFGEYGMMIAILAFGFILGIVYRWVMRHQNSRGILGMGLAPAMLLVNSHLENSIAKSIGGLSLAALVVWLILNFFAPRCLPWLGSNAQVHGVK